MGKKQASIALGQERVHFKKEQLIIRIKCSGEVGENTPVIEEIGLSNSSSCETVTDC